MTNPLMDFIRQQMVEFHRQHPLAVDVEITSEFQMDGTLKYFITGKEPVSRDDPDYNRVTQAAGSLRDWQDGRISFDEMCAIAERLRGEVEESN